MPTSNKIHYGWIVVGITCLVLLTSAGIRSTPGILMVPLEEEFHWSRATIALAVSINLILYGCIGPFAAAVMERFGIRRSVLCALALVGVGVASTSLMQYPWQLILMWGLLVGVGTGFLATVLAADRRGALVHGAARPRRRHPQRRRLDRTASVPAGDGECHRGLWLAHHRALHRRRGLRRPAARRADHARPAVGSSA